MLARQTRAGETCVNNDFIAEGSTYDFQQYYEIKTGVKVGDLPDTPEELIAMYDSGLGYVVAENKKGGSILNTSVGFTNGGKIIVTEKLVAIFYNDTPVFQVYKTKKGVKLLNDLFNVLPCSYESTWLARMTHTLPSCFASYKSSMYTYSSDTSKNGAGLFRSKYSLMTGPNLVGIFGFENSSFTLDVIMKSRAGVVKSFLTGAGFTKTPKAIPSSYGIVSTSLGKASFKEFVRKLSEGDTLPSIEWSVRYPTPPANREASNCHLILLSKTVSECCSGDTFYSEETGSIKLESTIISFNSEKDNTRNITNFINTDCMDVAAFGELIRVSEHALQDILDTWNKKYREAVDKIVKVVDQSILTAWIDPNTCQVTMRSAIHPTNEDGSVKSSETMTVVLTAPSILRAGYEATLESLLLTGDAGTHKVIQVPVTVSTENVKIPQITRPTMTSIDGSITCKRGNFAKYPCLFKLGEFNDSNLHKAILEFPKVIPLEGGSAAKYTAILQRLIGSKLPEFKSAEEIREIFTKKLNSVLKEPLQKQLNSMFAELNNTLDASNYTIKFPLTTTPSYANSGTGPKSRNDYSHYRRDGYWGIDGEWRKSKIGIPYFAIWPAFFWNVKMPLLPGLDIEEDDSNADLTKGGSLTFQDWEFKTLNGLKKGNERYRFKDASFSFVNITPSNDQKVNLGYAPDEYRFKISMNCEFDNFWVPACQEDYDADGFIDNIISTMRNNFMSKGWTVSGGGRTADYLVPTAEDVKVKYANNFERWNKGSAVAGYDGYYKAVTGFNMKVEKSVEVSINLSALFNDPFKGSASETEPDYNDPVIVDRINEVEDILFEFTKVIRDAAAVVASGAVMDRLYSWFESAGYIDADGEVDTESIKKRFQILVEENNTIYAPFVIQSFTDYQASGLIEGFDSIKKMLASGKPDALPEGVAPDLDFTSASKKASACLAISHALLPSYSRELEGDYRFFDQGSVDPDSAVVDLNIGPAIGML